MDQAGLELTDPLASASGVLELKACATTAWPGFWVFWFVCFVLLNKFSQVKSMVSFSFQKIEIQKNYKCYELQIRLH